MNSFSASDNGGGRLSFWRGRFQYGLLHFGQWWGCFFKRWVQVWSQRVQVLAGAFLGLWVLGMPPVYLYSYWAAALARKRALNSFNSTPIATEAWIFSMTSSRVGSPSGSEPMVVE